MSVDRGITLNYRLDSSGIKNSISSMIIIYNTRDSSRVILVCSSVALPAVKPTGGFISLFLVVNSNYLIN